MNRYFTLMKVGFFHPKSQASTFVMAVILSAIITNRVVSLEAVLSLNPLLIFVAGMGVFSFFGGFLFIWVFMPIRGLECARSIRREYGPKTEQSLMEHYRTQTQKRFNAMNIAINNKEMFY